ncbi:hypothetical protein GGI12_005059 [Dipsacomyces acuminosporus]|nr:hypothetical protein GGI12_005059 [Dipsacomyces acuminosporus]
MAQNILEEILEEVIYHVCGLLKVRRNQNAKVDTKLQKELLPFLQVCSHWRSVALPIFYMDIVLTTNDQETKLDKPGQLIHSLDEVLANRAEKLVRRAKIDVPFGAILSGKVADILSRQPYSSVTLPNVFHLDFIAPEGKVPKVGDQQVFRDNAVKLCNQIKRMFPNARSLFIDNSMRRGDYSDIKGDIVASLTSSKTHVLNYYGNTRYLNITELQHLANLTHITIFAHLSRQEIIELVYQNASSLEFIEIWPVKQDIFKQLVDGPANGNATPIVYPRLKKLNVLATRDIANRSHLEFVASSPKGTPFPSLTHLNSAGRYPFDNDVLFRGNNNTLESLDLCITPNLVEIINKHKLFAYGKYPRLKRIAFETRNYFQLDEELALSLARIPFELGPQVEIVKLELTYTNRHAVIMDSIRLAASPGSIRSLDIREFQLKVNDIFEILWRFPNLSHLKFSLIEQPINEQEEHRESPSLDLSVFPHLYHKYFPASIHLRSLHFESKARQLTPRTIANVLMIASLIPALQYVTGPWLYLHGKEYVQKAISHLAFAPYKRQLQSLKYLGLMNKDTKVIDIS